MCALRPEWFGALALSALAVSAQPSVATPASPQPMGRVEITARQSSDEDLRARASIAMAIYGREELDRHGDLDLSDVLQRLPGVSLEDGQPRVRGLGSGYTAILLNGEPAPPGFQMDSLAPGDVERIEVIRGASADYPGAAGTINVVLREPPRQRQQEWRTASSYRALQPGAHLAYQLGDRAGDWSWFLPFSASRTAQATQVTIGRRSRSSTGDVRAQQLDGDDRGRVGLGQWAPRLQWKPGSADTLSASAFVQQSYSQAQGARHTLDLEGTPSTNVRDASETFSAGAVQRAQFSWLHRYEEGARLEWRASWQQTTRRTDGDATSWRADDSVYLQRQSQSHFGETRRLLGARLTLPLSSNHTWSLGAEHETRHRDEQRRVWDNGVERIDRSDGTPLQAQWWRQSGFVQDAWALNDQLSLQPGLRVEVLRTQSGHEALEVDQSVRLTSPSLHLNWRPDPQSKSQWRASISHSHKLPDLGALLGRYVVNTTYERDRPNTPLAADRAGNPALQPERARGWDLAYEHYPAGGGVLSVGAFGRHIDGLIRHNLTQEPLPETGAQRWVARPVNLGQAHSYGLELELKGRAEDWLAPWFSPGSGVQVRAALATYRSDVEQIDGPDNRLVGQPPWSAKLGFDARLKASPWSLGASLVLQPDYATQQTDRQLSQRSAQRTLDLYALWRADRQVQVRIGISNAWTPDTVQTHSVQDLDGFTATSTTRRTSLRTLTLGAVWRW